MASFSDNMGDNMGSQASVDSVNSDVTVGDANEPNNPVNIIAAIDVIAEAAANAANAANNMEDPNAAADAAADAAAEAAANVADVPPNVNGSESSNSTMSSLNSNYFAHIPDKTILSSLIDCRKAAAEAASSAAAEVASAANSASSAAAAAPEAAAVTLYITKEIIMSYFTPLIVYGKNITDNKLAEFNELFSRKRKWEIMAERVRIINNEEKKKLADGKKKFEDDGKDSLDTFMEEFISLLERLESFSLVNESILSISREIRNNINGKEKLQKILEDRDDVLLSKIIVAIASIKNRKSNEIGPAIEDLDKIIKEKLNKPSSVFDFITRKTEEQSKKRPRTGENLGGSSKRKTKKHHKKSKRNHKSKKSKTNKKAKRSKRKH